jgi:hypothetical protein
VQSHDILRVENYASLAGVVVIENAVDLADDVSGLRSTMLLTPHAPSTAAEGAV